MEKSDRKYAPKATTRSHFNFSKVTKNSHCMQKILLKIRYFERGLSKSLKKVNFIFLYNPVPFNGQSFQKYKGPGTSEQSLFRLQNKFRKTPILVMYYLTKFDVII